MADFIRENLVLVTVCLITSIGFSVVILLTKRFHIEYSAKGHNGNTIQSVHKQPTPRLGGLPIIVSMILTLFYLDDITQKISFSLIVSVSVVFIVGLLDDLNFSIAPRWRLLAASLSSVAMIFISGYWIMNVSTPLLEPIMEITFIAIIFTVFATTGISHSFNLVDGLNGLALGITVIISFCLFLVALRVYDYSIAKICLLIVISCTGVLIFNFPSGKIFLGDAGAYSLGHLVSWLSIILIFRHPEISAWSILLCFFWPVTETLYSIYRRKIRGVDTSKADLSHFHQLIYRNNLKYFNGRYSNNTVNSMSTIFIIPLSLVAGICSYVFLFDSFSSILTLLFLVVFYIIIYKRLDYTLDKLGA